jgi:hypothetical protein
MAISYLDFFEPSEVEILVRCKQFVELRLKQQYRMLDWLEREGRETKFTKAEIAQLEYALGISKDKPNLREMYERG